MYQIIVFCAVLRLISGVSIPSYIQKCSLSDPDIDKCLLKATEDIKPYLKNGLPELGFPSLNPFVIPSLELQQGNEAVNYKLKLTNVHIYGFDDYKFEKFSYNPKTFSFNGTCHFNKMHVETDYQITGKVLAIQINGDGKFLTDIDSGSGSLTVKGKLIDKKEMEYFNPIHAEAKIKVSNYTSKLTGLFSENKELSKAADAFLVEHCDEILKEVMPVFENVASDIIVKSIEVYTRNVPYRELFLD